MRIFITQYLNRGKWLAGPEIAAETWTEAEIAAKILSPGLRVLGELISQIECDEDSTPEEQV